MKQLNRIVSGGGYTAGKAVLRHKDGTVDTGLNFVDGMGGVTRFLSDYDGNCDWVQINANYAALFSSKRETGIYYILIRLYKKTEAGFSYVKSFEFNAGANATCIRAENIFDNRVMIAYVGASSYGKALVMTLNPATETVTFTTEYTFFASGMVGQLDIFKTEDNRCVIAFANNSGFLQSVVATYLAPDIIFGSVLQLAAFANAQMIRIAQHDAGKYVIVNGHTTGGQLQATHIGITGSTITLYQTLTLYTGVTALHALDIQVLDVNKVVVITNSTTNTFATTLIPLIINGTNQIVLGTALSTGFGNSDRIGLAAYDKANQLLYVLHDAAMLQKFKFDPATNTFSEVTAERQTSLSRLGVLQVAATVNVSNSRVTPLSATQFLFFFAGSSSGYQGGTFFIFDVTKVDRPEILGVAITQSEYVAEGLVTGLSGLVAGEKYFVDASGNVVHESTRLSSIPTHWAITFNNAQTELENTFIGVAISPTELIIPARKKKTYIKGVEI